MARVIRYRTDVVTAGLVWVQGTLPGLHDGEARHLARECADHILPALLAAVRLGSCSFRVFVDKHGHVSGVTGVLQEEAA
jgi:hypothetical protein